MLAEWLQSRDPRWLVEPRQDGTNVNGWHWQDKNRFAWAKDKLEQALPELPPAEAGNVRISKVTDVVGEVRGPGQRLVVIVATWDVAR